MNMENDMNITPRKPFVAFLLSLPTAGLGHLYCGKLNKGMMLFFLSFAFVPIIIVTAIASKSTQLLLIVAISTILFRVLLSLYAIIDATLLARHIHSEYRLKEYNKWYIYLLLIAVSLFGSINLDLNIRDHIVRAFKAPSSSMIPSIIPGDYVWANKGVYKMQAVHAGDKVIFIYPNDRSKYFLKRVIALPGDTVEIKDNVVYINGAPLKYEEVRGDDIKSLKPYVKGDVMIEKNGDAFYKIMLSGHDAKTAEFKKMTVPNGYCFVMGDNRNNSHDSRQFGPVPLADVLGRVDYIYWPAVDWSRFGSFNG